MRERRALFRTLARALTDPETLHGALLTPEDQVVLTELAQHHRVVGQLAAAFEVAGLPVRPELAQGRQLATVGHLQKLQALQRATDALGQAGVGAVVVKGPVLAAHWYRDPGARTYHDLDLLVDPACFAAAIDVLKGVGFAERNRNWAGYRAVGMGEIPLHDGRVALDLHWHLVTFEAARRTFGFRTAALLDRRLPVDLGSVHTWTLADDDTLAHVLLHAGLAGARLLIHQRDVYVVASSVDRAAAERRVNELGMERLASATLDRVERTLGPIGADGRGWSRDGRVWRAMNAGIDRVWGVAVPRAMNAFPSAVLSSGRPTVAGTVWELGTQVTTAIRRRIGRPTVTSPGGPLDIDLDAGGAAERARYLDDVERGVFGR